MNSDLVENGDAVPKANGQVRGGEGVESERRDKTVNLGRKGRWEQADAPAFEQMEPITEVTETRDLVDLSLRDKVLKFDSSNEEREAQATAKSTSQAKEPFLQIEDFSKLRAGSVGGRLDEFNGATFTPDGLKNAEELLAQKGMLPPVNEQDVSLNQRSIKPLESHDTRRLIQKFVSNPALKSPEAAPASLLGTYVASERFEMRNAAAQNKIADAEKQNIEFAEAGSESVRDKNARESLPTGQEAPSALLTHKVGEAAQVKSCDQDHSKMEVSVSPKIQKLVESIFEKISSESNLLKSKDASSVSIRIQPDSKSEMVIRIDRADHGFRVAVGCDENSALKLSSSWSELQERLKSSDISVEPLKALDRENPGSQAAGDFDLHQQKKGRHAFEKMFSEPEMHWAGAMVESPGTKSKITKTMSRHITGWEGVA